MKDDSAGADNIIGSDAMGEGSADAASFDLNEEDAIGSVEGRQDVVVEKAPSEEREVADAARARRKKIRRRVAVGVLLALFAIIVAACVAVAVVCSEWVKDLPDYSDADSFNTVKPTEVYASDRTTLLAQFQLENRIPLETLDATSQYAVLGTVATEDERFYEHPGVDIVGIGRAVLNNISGGTLEGASTITQQLVRNTVLLEEMNDVTLKRKVREAYIALEVEKMYGKDEILLLYMNTINYGAGAYGIEAAAKRYYSKPSAELTLAEAALLVGIPQSPEYNNPLYYPDNAIERRNTVLDRMVSYGAISEEEAQAAKAEDIALSPTEPSVDGFVAYPYFASYVRDQLLSSYGLSKADVFKGGLTVYTTLDVEMQNMAEAAARYAESQMNEAMCVGLTAVDPNTGHVKAMVGGKDFYARQWNLASQEARQPGSSFKTFTLVTALEQGISPYTNVSCSSWVEIDGQKRIENIGGAEYGTRSISSAFAVSSNTGFARLCAAVTPEAVAETAHRMGITSPLDPVLSLTLGTSDVTTLEMANAYGTIANGGTRYEAVAIEQIVDRKGNVMVDASSPTGERALSPEVAAAAVDVMKGVVNGGTGTAARIRTGQPAAGKTGTSENYLDSYFAGFTPELSVGIWVGDPNRVVPATSLTGAHVFGYFMNDWCANRAVVDFPTAGRPTYTKHFSNVDLDLKNVKSAPRLNEADDTTGKTLKEALELLKEYPYEVREEYSDDVAAGTVIKQSIEGDKIVVVVSKGPDPNKKPEKEPEKPVKPDNPGEGSGGSSGGNTGGSSGSSSSGTAAGGGKSSSSSASGSAPR